MESFWGTLKNEIVHHRMYCMVVNCMLSAGGYYICRYYLNSPTQDMRSPNAKRS